MLAAITPAGRTVVEEATADLMAAGFALDVLDETQREQVFAALKQLRIGAGDFAAGDDLR